MVENRQLFPNVPNGSAPRATGMDEVEDPLQFRLSVLWFVVIAFVQACSPEHQPRRMRVYVDSAGGSGGGAAGAGGRGMDAAAGMGGSGMGGMGMGGRGAGGAGATVDMVTNGADPPADGPPAVVDKADTGPFDMARVNLPDAPKDQGADGSGDGTGTLMVGLVGHWKLDESAGPTAADSSGSGNHGTWSASPSSPVIDTVCAPTLFSNPRCLHFVGRGAHRVSVPDSPLINFSGPFTLAAWVYRTGPVAPSSYGGIIDKIDMPGGYRLLTQAATGKALFSVFGGAARAQVVSTAAIPVDLWTHLAAVHDGSKLRLYVSGVLDATTATTVLPSNNLIPMRIGGTNTGNSLDGRVDDARLYDRALNATEVQALAQGAE